MDKNSDTDNLKEISLTPCFTNLLKPTMNYLGEELKTFAQEKIETVKKAKKNKNVHDHIKKVQEKIDRQSNSAELTVQQLDLFNEWIENVADIDPDDKELSEIWQNLLLSQRTPGNSAKILLPKLKELDHEDAIVLLKLGNKIKSPLSEEEYYRLKKLEDLELVEKNDVFIDILPGLLFLGLVGIISLISSFYPLGEFIFNTSDKLSFPFKINYIKAIIFIGMPLGLYFLLAFGLLKKLRKKGVLARITRKPTWIGLKIINMK